MSEKLVATLTVSFDKEKELEEKHIKNKAFEDASYCAIVLEQMTSELSEALGEAQIIEDTLFFKCFPKSGVTIGASAGSVSISSEYRTDAITTVATFGGTDSSLLQYPEAKEVILEPLGMCIQEVVAKTDMTINGVPYNKGDVIELKTITPSFDFNEETNSIEAFDGFKKVEIYGHCLVKYKSDYSLVIYKPNFSSLVERTRNDKKKKGKSDKLYAGTIYAYRLFNKKTYAVSQDVDVDKVKSPEYARVYSKIVLDEDGSHEAPEGWPNETEIETTDGVKRNFNYLQKNGTIQKKELDPDMSFTDQRSHLIVYIDMFGNLIWEHQNHYLLDPFDSINVPCELKELNPKKPEFFLRFAAPPGGAKTQTAEAFMFEMMTTTWRDIFIIPDKAKFKTKILDYFGEMKGIEAE